MERKQKESIEEGERQQEQQTKLESEPEQETETEPGIESGSDIKREKRRKKVRKFRSNSNALVRQKFFSARASHNYNQAFFKFSLEPEVTDFVNQNLTSEAEGFSIAEISTVIITHSEDKWMGHNIPTDLSEKLTASEENKPVYVSLGSMNRWYVEFADGSCEWNGCDDMNKELRDLDNREEKPCWVAFGQHWDSYFIIYDSCEWCYCNIPEELDQKIRAALKEDRAKELALIGVSLGPNGEYFISVYDGKRLRNHCGGLTLKQMQDIDPIASRIILITFGDRGSYIARYN